MIIKGEAFNTPQWFFHLSHGFSLSITITCLEGEKERPFNHQWFNNQSNCTEPHEDFRQLLNNWLLHEDNWTLNPPINHGPLQGKVRWQESGLLKPIFRIYACYWKAEQGLLVCKLMQMDGSESLPTNFCTALRAVPL